MHDPSNPLFAWVSTLMGLGIRLALAYPVASHARKRGYGFRLFLLCGMFLSIVATAIFAWALPARSDEERSE